MLPPVPVLSDYGISPEYGFLPAELPLERLPDPYYHKWEAIVANLQGLILSKRLRGVIDRLPILSTAGLEHDSEWRRAYSLLCFMAHGYIWAGDVPSEVCESLARAQGSMLTPLSSVCQQPFQFRSSTSPHTLRFCQLLLMQPCASGITNPCLQMSTSITSRTSLPSRRSQALSTSHGSTLCQWQSKPVAVQPFH